MSDARQTYDKYSITLQPSLGEVAAGRRFLAEIAAEAGYPEERVFDITVACSEAMANAIEHSPVKGKVQVRAAVYDDRLEVEVEGPGEFQTPDRLKDRNSRGLGLPLMAKLSDHLALFSGPAGQTLVNLTFYKPHALTDRAGAVPPSFANLAEENQLLDDVLRHLPDGFYVLDTEWRFIYVNPAALSFAGTAVQDLLGASLWESFYELPPAARQGFETAMKARSVTRVVASTAAGRWWEWTAFPVEEGVAVYARDITERKSAEQALEHTRFMLTEAEAIAHVGSFEYKADTRTTVWSNEECRIYGLPEGCAPPSYQEMLERFIHPDDAAHLDSTFAQAMEDRAVYELEHRIVRPSGETRVVHDRAYPRIDDAGRLLGYMGATVDITERKQTEDELHRQTDLLQGLLRNVPANISVYRGNELRYVLVNAAYQAIAPVEDIVGRTYAEVFPEAAATGAEAHLRHVMETGERWVIERYRAPIPGKPDAVWEGEVVRLPVVTGEEPMILSVSRDVTESAAAEAALRNSEERYRGLVEQAADGIFLADAAGCYLEANSAGLAMLGYSLEELRKLTVLDLIFPEETPRMPEQMSTLADGQIITNEWVFRRKDGSSFTGELVGRQLPDGRLLGILRDITERRRVEEALRRQARLLDLSSDAIFVWGWDGPIVYWNLGAEALYGFSAKEAIGRVSHELLQTAFLEGFAAYQAALEQNKEWLGELRHTTKDGRTVIVEGRQQIVEDGPRLLVLETNRDITERRRAEEEREQLLAEEQALAEDLAAANEELSATNEELLSQTDELVVRERQMRESQDRLELLAGIVQNASQPIAIGFVDGRLGEFNQAYADLLGYSQEELRRLRWGAQLTPKEWRNLESRKLAELHAGEGPVRYEKEYVRKDGTRVPVELLVHLARDHGRNPLYYFSFISDLSERKRAEAERAQGEARMRTLLEVADQMAEWTDLDRLLDAALRAFVGATAHKRASVGLLDIGRRHIRIVASAGAEPLEPASTPLLSFSQALQDAVGGGKGVLVDYDRLPPDERQVADTYRARHAFIAPLVYHEQVTGIVLVDDPGEWVPFTPEEQDLITGIAAEVAVGLESARLYERQKNIAQQLQQTILDLPPKVTGLQFSHLYRSATEEAIVGGDFYDVFERPDGTIILLAGDVSGHGVNAARVATMVKASLAAFAQSGERPGAVLENANRLLMRKRVPGFTSVLLASYDPSTGLLEYCSAGHPNLIVGRPGGMVEIVGRNHAPLGVFPDWSCSVDAVQVRPGDTLLLYTDGLTEARKNGTLFGEKRLSEALGSRLDLDLADLPQVLLDEALEFSDGRLQDDVAILAVRPTGYE